MPDAALPDIERTLLLLPKQEEFVFATEKEVLYSGAYGSGKTRALCHKVVRQACIPGNPVGLVRKSRVSLVRTTLRTLLEPDAGLPPVLPRGSYDHLKGESRINIHDGGHILYFGADQADSMGSLNLGSCGADECVELGEDEWMTLLGQIRNMADPLRQLFGACNPGARSHHLYKKFYEEKSDKRRLIHTRSHDNTFLPQDYLDVLDTYTGARKQRYVEGLWVGFDSLVYGDVWDRDVHLTHRDEGWRDIIVGCDEGYTNPAAMSKWGIDSDARMHLLDTYYKRKILQSEFVQEAKAMGASAYIVDPSAAGLIAAMREAGLNVIGADNAVMTGIALMQDRLAVAGDGRPRMTAEPHCEEWTREIEAYEWDGDKDKPKKEMDHLMDTGRYVCAYLDRGMIHPGVGSAGSDRPDETTPEETPDKRYERLMGAGAGWVGDE